jgi:hypothetical protein
MPTSEDLVWLTPWLCPPELPLLRTTLVIAAVPGTMRMIDVALADWPLGRRIAVSTKPLGCADAEREWRRCPYGLSEEQTNRMSFTVARNDSLRRKSTLPDRPRSV